MRKFLCLFVIFIAYAHFSLAAVAPVILDNGKKILTLPSNHLPMVYVQLTFKQAGVSSESLDKAGLTTLAAAMLKEGSGELDRNAFRKEMEDAAIEISVSSGQENLTLSAQSLTLHAPKMFALLTAMLTKPRFDAVALETVRSQMLSSMQKNSENPAWMASVAFDKRAFGNHRYSLPNEGVPQSVKAITAQDLRAWHARYISSDNAVISAAGDVETDAFKHALNQFITHLPTHEITSDATLAPIVPSEETPIIVQQSIPQTVAMFGLPAVARNHPDFYPLYVMEYILGGGGLTSRLSSEIRQERGLAYYASTSFSPGEYSAAIYGSFATKNVDALQAATLARQVLANFATKGATADERKNAIDYITGSFPLALDTLGAQASYLNSMQLYNLGDDYLEKRNTYFQNVTLNDINRVAAKYLAKPPLMVLVGNPNGDT